MPDLNIKNAETYRLVKELADTTGTSMTAAVTEAVRERLERIRHEGDRPRVDLERGLALLAEMRARLPPGYLDQDLDAMLYDERGLPR
jgi:antitoxin VapB